MSCQDSRTCRQLISNLVPAAVGTRYIMVHYVNHQRYLNVKFGPLPRARYWAARFDPFCDLLSPMCDITSGPDLGG